MIYTNDDSYVIINTWMFLGRNDYGEPRLESQKCDDFPKICREKGIVIE
jgi:hypothetical protein